MNIKEEKEYYKDGTLSYSCTKALLEEHEEFEYDYRIGISGNSFIRVGEAVKYNKDGSIRWKLIYNNKGQVIGNTKGVYSTQKLKYNNLSK